MAWKSRKRQTDAGTIMLHWWLAISLLISTLTGLRFAVDMPDTGYLDAIEPILPVTKIWIVHILAGVSVMMLAVAYPLYLRKTGLVRRITLDMTRIRSLAVAGPARWGAVNVLLYWLLFGCILVQLVTGVLLHRGHGGIFVQIHLATTWLIILYAGAHITAHALLGGRAQLMRVLRPSRIPVPPAEPGHGKSNARASRPLLPAGFKAIAASSLLGIAVGTAFLYFDHASRDVLVVRRVAAEAARGLRGDLSDPIWRATRPLTVHTNQGVNLNGAGSSDVEIRAVHDGASIYFAISWDDPTRSLKHAPLIKAADGWHALFTEKPEPRHAPVVASALEPDAPRTNFEGAIAEDKFAIMLVNVEKPFGPGAFHPGSRPLRDAPPSSSSRGLHYTDDGSRPNVWVWHANGGESRRCENARVGPPARPTQAQMRGLEPYKGGITLDAPGAVVAENFTPSLPRDRMMTVQPLRVPADAAATRRGMGNIDLVADHGDPETSRWAMTKADSIPYSREVDAKLPVGTMIPGILAASPTAVASADVSCMARWAAGRWTLLAHRRLETGRPDEIKIGGHTHIWLAAFDHTPANHTRHIRPLRLELSP